MKRTLNVLLIAVTFTGTPAATTLADETIPFEWDVLLACSIKLQDDYNFRANVDSYLEVFEPDTWKQVKDDEFELEEQRRKTIEKFQREAKAFSIDRDMTINTCLTLGEYDFESECFPVTSMTESHYWAESRYRTGTFPGRFKVYLKNHELLSTLPMPKEEARKFLQRRKDSRGRINRRIDSVFRVRIVKLKRHSRSDMYAELQSATLYENKHKKAVLRVVKKEEPKPEDSLADQSLTHAIPHPSVAPNPSELAPLK